MAVLKQLYVVSWAVLAMLATCIILIGMTGTSQVLWIHITDRFYAFNVFCALFGWTVIHDEKEKNG